MSRLLAAFSFVLLLTFAASTAKFYDIAYYKSINIPIFIVSIAAIFALLYFVPWDNLINCFLIINLAVYFALAASDIMDYWFSFGMCLVLCMAVYYFDFGKIRFKPPKWSLWVTVGAMATIYAVVIGLVCCIYYWDYWTATYDFGVFSQMFYNMKQTGEMLTTCERDGLLSHFAVHFSLFITCFCLFTGSFPLRKLC